MSAERRERLAEPADRFAGGRPVTSSRFVGSPRRAPSRTLLFALGVLFSLHPTSAHGQTAGPPPAVAAGAAGAPPSVLSNATSSSAAQIFYEAAYDDEVTGDPARAYARYGDALRAGGLSPALRWRAEARRALLLEHLGRREAALAALRRVVTRWPPSGEQALWALVRERAVRLAAGVERDGIDRQPAARAFDRLASPDPAVRYGAIAELKRLPPEVAVPETIVRTADANPKIRHYAVILAGHFGDRRALAALGARLTDPVWDIRVNAARALFKLGETRGRGTLIAALAEAPLATRRLAAFYLVEMDDPAGARVLVGALSDRDLETRARALQALMRLAHRDARGFDPEASETARAPALARWEAWLARLESGAPPTSR